MNNISRMSGHDAAQATGMQVEIVWYYAELGLVSPASQGFDESDLAVLRRVRRLQHDLELDHAAIEIVLRMRGQIEALQAELQRLQHAAAGTRSLAASAWQDAEWDEM